MTETSTKPTALEPVWVRNTSSVPGLADLVISSITEHGEITLRAVGAGAVNQGLKGIAAARRRVTADAKDLIMRPMMQNTKGDRGDDVVVMVMRCTLL